MYFIAPTVWGLAAPDVLESRADWLDIFGAFERMAGRHPDGRMPESLTAIAAWIVIPRLLGLWFGARREVKIEGAPDSRVRPV